jgi:hypothetical protein
MVIRSSFVTNSSSSSFVCLDINSQEVADIIREFEDELREIFECGDIMFHDDSHVEIYMDEAYAELPNSPKDIVNAIAGLFDYNFMEDMGYAEEDGEEMDMSQYSEAIQRLVECKDEIMANLKYFKMSCGNQGWQGDDDSRYNEDWYEPEALEDVKASIAAEKDCEIDEITEEDFCEYVGDKISIEEEVFEYDGDTKEVTKYRTTELEG